MDTSTSLLGGYVGKVVSDFLTLYHWPKICFSHMPIPIAGLHVLV